MAAQLTNLSNLVMNGSFATLFTFIVDNSTVYDQLMPNISIVKPLEWTTPLSQLDKQTLIANLLSNSLPVFYALM